MQNARVTFLTTPDRKAAIEAKAADLGVSSAEYISLAVDNFDRLSAREEQELSLLVDEVNSAIPGMMRTIDDMAEMIRNTRSEVERSLREVGFTE